jgi:hypothetical protein
MFIALCIWVFNFEAFVYYSSGNLRYCGLMVAFKVFPICMSCKSELIGLVYGFCKFLNNQERSRMEKTS